MRHLAILIVAVWATAAIPQEAAEGGSSGLAGLLERSLSNETMQVRVEGLRGALSSAARIERLSFSDSEGVWLVIEEAVLDWNRTALLRGRVDVNRLEAERIILERTPSPSETEDLPSATARSEPFALPELPVSIEIDTLSVPMIILREGVLGEEVVASLDGRLQLAGGDAEAELDLQRTDVEGTRLTLDTDFSNSTSVLNIDLEMRARPGGLLVRKLGLPNAPGLDLNVQGAGPLSDFEAEIALRSDDALRLGGTVALLAPEDAPQRVVVDISGDVRPLLTPDLRGFFGPDTALRLTALSNEDGSRDLQGLRIKTESFDLYGKARLGVNNWPENIALAGLLGRADELDVRLPIPGEPVLLRRGKIALNYDAAQDSVWSLVLAATSVTHQTVAMEAADLRAAGRLTLPSEASDGGVAGQLLVAASGMDFFDPALNTAAGSEMQVSSGFDWTVGGDLNISDLSVSAAGAELEADFILGDFDSDLKAEGALRATLADLSRFSRITGQDLVGGLDLDASGTAALRTGAFDITLTGNGRDLRSGIDVVDTLLLGTAEIGLSAARDENGFTLREARAETPALSFSAEGDGTASTTRLETDLRLDNLARLVPGFPGPVSATGTLEQVASGFAIDIGGNGPGGLGFNAAGTLAEDLASVDLAVDGTAQLALLNPVLGQVAASGNAAVDLTVSGPPALGSVSGRINLSDGRFAETETGIAIQGLTGQIALANSTAQIDLRGQGNRGGSLTVAGGLGLTPPLSSDLTVETRDFAVELPGLLTTTVTADIGLNGTLPNAATLGGQIRLGPTEIRIPDGGAPSAITEGIVHVGDRAEVRQTRERAGIGADDASVPTSGGGSGGLGLDLNILAENRIFVRGFGLDAELTGDIEVGGTTSSPRPTGEIELVRGRLSVLSQRLDLTEGRVQLLATLVPELYFAAETSAEDADITMLVTGPANDPDLEVISSPPLPEDEALARLLFGRSLNDLSGFQALQLANAVIALRSGTGLGTFNQLREGTGLDDLDLTSDEDGNANLRVGKYLTEDIYTNVDVNARGGTDLSINIDLTKSVTARGTVSNDGNDSIGLFFERDY